MCEGADCERDIFVEIEVSSTDATCVLILGILFEVVFHKKIMYRAY